MSNLTGTADNDTLTGTDLKETIFGKKGDDTITGGGVDDIFGDQGDDILDGGPGSDALDGGSGNDTVVGGYSDVMDGASGNDKFDFSNITSLPEYIKGGSGDDTLILAGLSSSGLEVDDANGDGQQTTMELILISWFQSKKLGPIQMMQVTRYKKKVGEIARKY